MLEANGVTLRRGRLLALDGVSLAVAPGEVVALVGPNGAGKSSLLACLSGALRPDAGRVRIDGDDPARLAPAELARRRAVLDQTPTHAQAFTVRALAALPIPTAVSPGEAGRMVDEAIAAVGLEDLAGRTLDQLSGGERQRAHMARALAQLLAGRALGGGRWLLLDEPTAGLDLAHQDAVARAARTAADAGAGVLAVLHDLTLAAALADRIAILNRGKLVAEGPPDRVLTPERIEDVYALPVAVDRGAGALSVTPLYTCRH